METHFGINRNESDWFGMNFNPKLLPEGMHSQRPLETKYISSCKNKAHNCIGR